MNSSISAAQAPFSTSSETTVERVFHLTVIVAALGYFVDIYDLLLFGIVRVPSLREMGVPASELMREGVFLLNMQMIGMLLGGVLWGVLGDKRGRLEVLFGSILLYSIANLVNAAISSVPLYGFLRFVAGIGLAGELGAAVTLVSETLHTSKRGYGTAMVAGVGILGAVFAGFVAELTTWRTAYVVGGLLGLGLLLLRVKISESGMYAKLEKSDVRKGDLKLLFASRERVVRYLCCILIGVPVWYLIGILVTFAPEFGREMQITDSVSAAKAIAFCYAGCSLGDFFSGALSQFLGSRKRVVLMFLILTALVVPTYLGALKGASPLALYLVCSFIGFSGGYWAVFVTTATEQFGTNLRATVTTTVPNIVRGCVVPLTFAFQLLRGAHSLRQSAAIVGMVVFVLALWALSRLQETSQRDLNFFET